MNLAKREDKLRVIEIFKESYIANIPSVKNDRTYVSYQDKIF
jgi:hypothetical protein